jgi:hypothetical protein
MGRFIVLGAWWDKDRGRNGCLSSFRRFAIAFIFLFCIFVLLSKYFLGFK